MPWGFVSGRGTRESAFRKHDSPFSRHPSAIGTDFLNKCSVVCAPNLHPAWRKNTPKRQQVFGEVSVVKLHTSISSYKKKIKINSEYVRAVTAVLFSDCQAASGNTNEDYCAFGPGDGKNESYIY